MNQQQINILVQMAEDLLHRASAYLDQAEASGTSDFGHARLTTRRLRALLTQSAPWTRDSDYRERYCDLAIGVLAKVHEIYAILRAAGCDAGKLEPISVALRDTTSVAYAVRACDRATM